MRWFDHEDAVAFRNRQSPAALGVRYDDVSPVGYHDVWNARIADGPPPRPAPIMKHLAARYLQPLCETHPCR